MFSWSKKDKKGKEQAAAGNSSSKLTTSETVTSYNNSSTTTTIITSTRRERTFSSSYVENHITQSASASALTSRSNAAQILHKVSGSIGDLPTSTKVFTSNNVGTRKYSGPSTTTDAKPINLNYQSPYRNSPVYRSLGHKPATSAAGGTTTERRAVPFPKSPSLVTSTTGNFGKFPTPLPSTSKTSSSPSLYPSTSKTQETPPEKPKEVKVKKTKTRFDVKATSNNNSPISVYQTSTGNRGEVLIINNIMFKDRGYRKGAELDDKNLKTLFKQIGFNVNVKRDLNKSKMESAIRDFSNNSKLKSAAISIVVVMSHGTNNKVTGGYTEVYGLDDQGLSTETIIEFFNDYNCPQMAGKPKIFIFQCCRGDDEYFLQKDAKVFRQPKTHSDMLIAYSTLPGFVSHRDPEKGTWYIQTICDVFSQYACDHHVEELLKIVGDRLQNLDKSAVQTSTFENRGFNKKCYLHPLE